MRRNRGHFRVASLLAAGLVAGACTAPRHDPGARDPGPAASRAAAGRGGTLRIAGGALDELDPARAYSTTSWFLARGVFRTLVSPAPATAEEARPGLVGDLATDAGTPNQDFTRWRFTLRPEARFGPGKGGRAVPGVTGERVVCDDVKYGLERLFRPTVGAAYEFYYRPLVGTDAYGAGSIDEITGISCPDDRSIVFDLDRPVPGWPQRLILPAATPVPRSVAEPLDASGDGGYADVVVATGPYAIGSITDRRIRLLRNKHWDESGDPVRAGRVAAVRWRTDLAPAAAIERVLDGRLDLLIGIEPRGSDLAKAAADRKTSRRLIHEGSGCLRAIYLDTSTAPFDRTIVRRAVALALDRYALDRMIGGPAAGSIATSVLPPGIPGHLPADEFDPFASPHGTGDVDAARRMLERAGFSGWDEPITIAGAEGPGGGVLGSVRTDLERLGFTAVRTRAVRGDRLFALYRGARRPQVGTGVAWCKDMDDASTILRPLFYGSDGDRDRSYNFARLDDAELNDLIDRADALPPGPERASAWEAANRRATLLAAWIPWSWDSITILYGERLRGAHYLSFLTHIDWPNVSLHPVSGKR